MPVFSRCFGWQIIMSVKLRHAYNGNSIFQSKITFWGGGLGCCFMGYKSLQHLRLDAGEYRWTQGCCVF